MNGDTIGFHPQTQKLELHYVSIIGLGSERVKPVIDTNDPWQSRDRVSVIAQKNWEQQLLTKSSQPFQSLKFDLFLCSFVNIHIQ